MRTFYQSDARRPQFEVCLFLFQRFSFSVLFYVSSFVMRIGVIRNGVFCGSVESATSGKKVAEVCVMYVSIASASVLRTSN